VIPIYFRVRYWSKQQQQIKFLRKKKTPSWLEIRLLRRNKYPLCHQKHTLHHLRSKSRTQKSPPLILPLHHERLCRKVTYIRREHGSDSVDVKFEGLGAIIKHFTKSTRDPRRNMSPSSRMSKFSTLSRV